MARGGGNRSRLLLVLLLVSSLFFITLDLRGVNLAGSIRGSVASVFSPVEALFSRVFSPIGNFAGDIRNIGQASEKIEKLNKEIELLKSKEILDEDMVGQLNQLKNILDLAGRGGYKVVAAKVINRGSSATFKETITIDVGSSSGISRNMTVISDGGLVGVVKSVSSESSVVLLMNDPSFKMGVRIAGSQSIGVLSGQGGNSYLLQLLDAAGEIKLGDKLVARGSDGSRPFVPGVPVGTVVEVQSNASSITQNADVIASANLDRIGIVAVVVSAPKFDPRDSLIPKPNPTVTVYVTPTPTPTPSN
ncbi:MAG: rod shape-determining protein MreC [Actinobacteria bacterium]|nr:rod shape-determining protein MreC [Actinomycetota bacterium]